MSSQSSPAFWLAHSPKLSSAVSRVLNQHFSKRGRSSSCRPSTAHSFLCAPWPLLRRCFFSLGWIVERGSTLIPRRRGKDARFGPAACVCASLLYRYTGPPCSWVRLVFVFSPEPPAQVFFLQPDVFSCRGAGDGAARPQVACRVFAPFVRCLAGGGSRYTICLASEPVE